MASQTSLIGAAGEHYVLCELLRRSYIAAFAPAGVSYADIVVTDSKWTQQYFIQVKTRRGVGADGGWHLDIKHEKIIGERLFYCFVDLQESNEKRPLVALMPSAEVATSIAAAHQKWLDTPGKKGQKHKDNPMRRLLPDFAKSLHAADFPYGADWFNKYIDAWDLLKLDPIDPEHTIDKE